MASQADNTPVVEDYYDKVHVKTWSRRTAGFITGATLFGGFGMIGGALAAFLPYALGAAGIAGASAVGAPTALAIASNAALFGGAAAWLGMSIASDVGANAGSVAAGLEEKEKREAAQQPAKQRTAPAPQEKPKMFNWKVSLVVGLMFAAFGALIAFNPLTASAVASMGFAAASPAASIASGTVLGMLGATMGINFPVLSNKISNYYSKLLKGKLFEPAPAQPQVETVRAPELPSRAQAQEVPAREGRSFAAEQKRFSLDGILEKNEENSAELIRR